MDHELMIAKNRNSPGALNGYASPAEPAYETYVEDSGVDLRHYWHVVWRRKFAILGLVFAAGLFALVWAYSVQPIFRSTATLLVGGDQPLVRTEGEAGTKSDHFFTTQVQLLQSREVAQEALRRLDEQLPGFDPIGSASEPGFDWRHWVPRSLQPGGDSGAPLAVSSSDPDAARLGWLFDSLQVLPVRDTAMVKVSFDATSPGLAARVTNAVAESYIATHLAQRREFTEQASDWLKGQLEKSQQAVLSSLGELQAYREQQGLVDMKGMENVYTAQLREVAAQLAAARQARMHAENVYQRATQLHGAGQMVALDQVLNHPRVQQLTDREQELERQIRLDSEHYRVPFPGQEQAQEALRAVREQRSKVFGQILDALKNDYEVAITNEQRLEAEVVELESKVQALNQKESQATALEQLVGTNTQSYDAFLKRLMDMSTQHEDTVSLIARIVDRAVPVLTPVKPNKPRMVAVAMVLALMAGIGLAFLLDRLDNTLKSREDVEERLGLAVLGEVSIADLKDPDGESVPAGQGFLRGDKSRFAEDIRTIRTAVALSGLGEGQQVLVLTSTTAGEGKTTVAVNLAQALGQLRNVLLIEADLRRPNLAKLFELGSNAPGLVDLVAGSAKVSECVHLVAGDLHLLPAGSAVPADPLKLIGSKRFADFLERTAEAYDTVIVDAPPVEPVSDAKMLSAQSNGVIFVIKADDTPYQLAQQSLKALRELGAPVIGAVLNQIDPKRVGSYARYGKYGGYGHYQRYARYGYTQST